MAWWQIALIVVGAVLVVECLLLAWIYVLRGDRKWGGRHDLVRD